MRRESFPLSRFETGNPEAACDIGKLSLVLLHDFFLFGEDRAEGEDTLRRGGDGGHLALGQLEKDAPHPSPLASHLRMVPDGYRPSPDSFNY